MQRCYIKWTHFLENYCAAFTKTYWALKKEETVNLTIFVLFTFFYLRNIRGTYSKYFENNIYKTNISCASRQ